MLANMNFKLYSNEHIRPGFTARHEPTGCRISDKPNPLGNLERSFLKSGYARKQTEEKTKKSASIEKRPVSSQCSTDKTSQFRQKKQELESKLTKAVSKSSQKELQSSRNEGNKIQRLPLHSFPTISSFQCVEKDADIARFGSNIKICKTNSYCQQPVPRYSAVNRIRYYSASTDRSAVSARNIFRENRVNSATSKIERAELQRKISEIALPNSIEAALTKDSEKETYILIEQQVEEAIKNQKIFLIRAEIPYLESVLKKRGWVQKYESTKTRHLPYGSAAQLDTASVGNLHLPDGTMNEKYIIFTMLRHIPPDFIWDSRNNFIEWSGEIKQNTLLNRLQRSFIYTSKLGMANVLDTVHWYNEENIASVQYPRSYNVLRENSAFIDDYRRTAAVSLLKWFVQEMQGSEVLNRGNSPIPIDRIEFAIKRCEEILERQDDGYLDKAEVPISSQEWDDFLKDYVRAVHEGNGIMSNQETDYNTSSTWEEEKEALNKLCASAEEILKKIRDVDPQYELNGIRNIWILKPSNLCCGTGIVMTHDLHHIIKKVHDCAKDYFIVQKYIEKPLLVHNTKFDVRQWYLVTKSYPLTIWMYNSRPFTFDNYHEIVHICNTAVQNKYVESKSSIRSQDWDCNRLNDYLKTIGYKDEPWYEVIFPKMRQAIIATMLAAQEHMDRRKNSFELYGADFVIMEDLSVWLIEINTNPRMHPPSTRVTQRLYPDVLNSLIKVVMDYPDDPNADTGNFVLAYKQDVPEFQPYLGPCMFVTGKAISS